jgi:hypothetical protein
MVPTLGGWTRKVAEIEEHRANFGKVNQVGCLVVQSGRKADYRVEQAIDLFSCLPEKRQGAALIFAWYCTPWMLDGYCGLLAEIGKAGLTVGKEGWTGWSRPLEMSRNQHLRWFWTRAARRRVLGRRDLR